jgi:hypothetical protein
MKRFVEGADREQSRLPPECLDDCIDEENPVRAIDAFVDALDLGDHGFDGAEPATSGSDLSQLARVDKAAKAVFAVGDSRSGCRSRLLQQPGDPRLPRGRYHRDAARADDVGHQVGRPFGKQDFVYLPDDDVYRCPAGERLTYRCSNEEDSKDLRRYWTTACSGCSLKPKCTTGPERRVTRWEHEHLLEAAQRRLDSNPNAMRQRRETVEHPFGTIKARMGAAHFLMKTLPKVAAEMALHVLAYNLTRVTNIIGIKPPIAAVRA